MTGVGALVQALAPHAVEQAAVPGLAAMDPDGEVIAALNRAPLPAGPPARYYAISSCFDASMPGSAAGLTAYAKKAILARISGRLSHGLASDLVVHNGSTHALHPGLVYSERHHFAANPSVYHVNFFFQPEVIRIRSTTSGAASRRRSACNSVGASPSAFPFFSTS